MSVTRTSKEEEISLRDLYLIFKKGLPLIILVALAAGIAVFFYTSSLDPVYEAESTTIITPPPISIQGEEGIRFSPSVNVTFEAYETLALSRPVMEATLARFPELDMSVRGLRGASRLERLIGPQRPGEAAPLSVSHRVRHNSSELSAALSNAWTEVTLETIRNSLLADLGPVDEATEEEVEALRARLEEAEARWAAFWEENTIALLERRIDHLTTAITEAEAELITLTELTALPGAELQSAPRINLEQEIAANQALLESLREQAGENPDAELQLQIISRQAILESLQVRRELLREQRSRYREELEEAQKELASLTRRRDALTRDVDNARSAYQEIIRLQPTISYVTQLAPLSARILSEASVPDAPVGPRRGLNSAVALLLGAFVATLFVFFREAVSGPTPRDRPNQPVSTAADD